MNFESTSRRDDFISLFYVLATILNNNKFPCTSDNFDPVGENDSLETDVKYQLLL